MTTQINWLKVGIGVTAVVVATVTTLYLWPSKPTKDAASFEHRVPVSAAGTAQHEAGISVSGPAVVSPSNLPTSYKKFFTESHNYFEFAQNALPAAQAGDTDAQFFLSKALRFCDEMYGAYFQSNGEARTLDEGLIQAANWKLSIEFAQSIYDRCQDFQEHDATRFGKAMEWLEKAAEAGQPAAQATMAAAMLQQQHMRDFLKAGAAPTPENTAPLIGNGADPTVLIQAAVRSGDTEALFNIGWAQALLNPGSDGNTSRLAWMLVACDRGFDCSANADWVRSLCSHCDTSSPVNLVRSSAGAAWPSVQQRAQEIGAKLDAGQWSELGLGS